MLDKGFQGEDSDGEERRMTVYGGSDENLTANTHVEVNDGLYKLIVGRQLGRHPYRQHLCGIRRQRQISHSGGRRTAGGS